MFEKRIRPNNPDCRVVAGQPEQTGVLTQPEQTETGNPDTKEAQQRHNQGLERLHRKLSGGNQPQVEELGEGDPGNGIQRARLTRRGFIKFLGIGFVSCFVPPYSDDNNKGGILNPSPLPKKSSGGSSRLAEVRGEQSRAVNPDTTNLPTQSTQSAGKRHTASLQQFRRGETIEENDPREGIPMEDLLLIGLPAGYFLLSEGLTRMFLKLRRLRRFPYSSDKIEVGENQITVFLDQESQQAKREKPELYGIIHVLRKACNFLPESFLSRTNAFLLETRNSSSYSGMVHPMDNNVILNVARNFSHSNHEDFLSTIFHELTHTITHRYIFRLILSLNLKDIWFNLKILNRDELHTWLEISKNNGGYLSKFFFPRKNWDSVKSKANKKGFGFSFQTEYRYGALSITEDIACVFEKVLTSVYLTFEYIEHNRIISEDEKKTKAINMAKELMELTPGDVDLYKKYVIACNILIRMYGEELKQKQERARALGETDTQLSARIQLITEIIGILRIFRETFDHEISSHTQNTGLTTKSPVMTNGDGRSDKTNFDFRKNEQGSPEGQKDQRSLNTSGSMSRREFLQKGLSTGLGFLTRGLGDPGAKS